MPTARYRYRIYPNSAQRQQLARQFGCCRFVYNWALATKKEAYEERGESLSVFTLNKHLTALKKEAETEWLNEVSVAALQGAIADMGKAYANFFRRVKQGAARPGFPRFKRKGNEQSAYFAGSAYGVREGRLRIARVPGLVRVRWDKRPLPSAPSSVTVIQQADGTYYASFVVQVSPTALPKTGQGTGLDLGITDLVTTSQGWKSGNPKHLQRSQAKLRREQKRLSRKTKGSSNWHKQRAKVARVHSRVVNQRREFLHVLSTQIVRENDLIAVEDLNVSGMVKNHSLARAISDAGWRTFREMLRYKAEWYGREFVEVGRFFASSKTCSACGEKADKMPLSIREWSCPCGATHDRDTNAAENILAEAKRILADTAGGTVTPADPGASAPNAPGGDVSPATASAVEADACERGIQYRGRAGHSVSSVSRERTRLVEPTSGQLCLF